MRATFRSAWCCLGLVVTTIVWSGEARADAIGPGPAECPDGSTPDACHGAEYCDPVTCTSDASCTGGKICKPVSVCIRPDACFGGDSDSDTPVKDLVKMCGEGVTCSEGACEQLILCIDPEEPTSGGTAGSSTAASSDETGGTGDKKGGCSCRADGENAPGLLLATALGLVLRRRRR